MLATIRLALKNPDMERLLKHSREALSVETGQAYYDLDEFDTSLRVNVPVLDVEIDIADTVNVWNVFTFLGPNALVDSQGRGIIDFAHPSVTSSAKGVMSLKEATAIRMGLPKLARMLGEMEGGGELMRDFITGSSTCGARRSPQGSVRQLPSC